MPSRLFLGAISALKPVVYIPSELPSLKCFVASFHRLQDLEESLTKLCKGNRPHEAIRALASLDPNKIALSRDPLYQLLQQCAELKELQTAQRLHCLLISSGLEFITVLLDHLIRVFSLCGSLQTSYQVFLKVPTASVYTWNAIITAHNLHKQDRKALDLYNAIQEDPDIMPDKVMFLCNLQTCINLKEVDAGRLIHKKVVAIGLESDVAVGSSLVHLYAECGVLRDMHQVFDDLPSRDVISWGVITLAYARHGDYMAVISLYEKLEEVGIQPDRGMYMCFLKSCGALGDIQHGRQIHEHIRKGPSCSDTFLHGTIIDMYSLCGSLNEAREVFDKTINPDVVTWGAMMSAYVQHGQFFPIVHLYEDMLHEGIQPDRVIFLFMIKACSSLSKLPLGRLVHDEVIRCGFDSYLKIGNSLLDLYAKCGSLEEAGRVFDKLPTRDVVSWGIIMAGYAENGCVNVAFENFSKMKSQRVFPNAGTFVSILKACGDASCVEKGRLIHHTLILTGWELDAGIGNALLDMYARCQSLKEANKVFDGLPYKDVVTWSALMSGFVQHGDGLQTLYFLENMLEAGVILDVVVFVSALKACGSLAAVTEGQLIHDKIVRLGFESHMAMGNALVYMYAKSGHLEDGHKAFNSLASNDVVSWGTLIGGYAQHGHGYPAIVLLESMQQEGVYPDQATLVCALKACGVICAAHEGRLLHDFILRSKFACDNLIGNALVDMYLKCGSLSVAQKVFDGLANKDIVSWTTMLVGYTRHGHGYGALELYQKMKEEGLGLTRVLYLCLLQACVGVGAVAQGRTVHEEASNCEIVSNVAFNNTLLELYAKWGDLAGAEQVFRKLPQRDIVSWSVIMGGYAAHGKCRLVHHSFHAMLQDGFEPDNMVFTTILCACTNAGLLYESFIHFKSMIKDHGVTPDLELYSCIVDSLGRAGMVVEALKLASTLPVPPDDVIWKSLLASSKTYGSMDSVFQSFDLVL